MSLRITIIRHAKASQDPGYEDFARPLTERGKADAERMAAFLERRLSPPQWLLRSPALRAMQTAQAMAAALRIDESVIVPDANLYLADPHTLLGALQVTPDFVRHLMLVGHNPGLLQLANLLDPECGLARLPTCGVMDMDLHTSLWCDVRYGCGQLLNFFAAKQLRGSIAT